MIITPAIQNKIKRNLRVNIKLHRTLNKFRKKNSNYIILLKNIYNIRYEFRVELLKNLTFTQALIIILKKRKR